MLASAKEMAPLGIRVNMISPGYLENAVDLPLDLQVLPLKRAGRLSEVADIVADLFEPAYSYVTGQNIEVAGGICL
jgi:NAD(P)-dependent dehydrogenase (short-subunit alcohol dehydrogenase family)